MKMMDSHNATPTVTTSGDARLTASKCWSLGPKEEAVNELESKGHKDE